MKISRFHGGLLVTPLPLSARCSSLSLTPSTVQSQKKQAALSTASESMSRISGRSFDDLTLLKAIKDNATRLCDHHSNKNIIRLKDWKK